MSAFLRPLKSFQERRLVQAVTDAQQVIADLSRIQVGENIPDHVYVGDYDTNTIPPWQCVERRDDGPLTILVVVDSNARATAQGLRPAYQIFVARTQVLQTPMFMWGPEGGYGPKRAMLGNPIHNGKLANQGKLKPKRKRKSNKESLWGGTA